MFGLNQKENIKASKGIESPGGGLWILLYDANPFVSPFTEADRPLCRVLILRLLVKKPRMRMLVISVLAII